MKRPTPLNAMRAFEAAARTGSFANAARELGVSSAAVSQQVKQLEEYWGRTLFIRQGNRIALTDAGLTAYPKLGQSIAALSDLSEMMHQAERRKRLVLSAPQSIAETWLARRLTGIKSGDLRRTLDIRVEDDPVDLVRQNVDIRIFYGHDLYTDYQVEPLYSDDLVAIAAPSFVVKFGSDPKHIADRDLIHTEWGKGFSTSPNWGDVPSMERIVDHNAGLRVQASSTALNFVRQGFGAALIPHQFAQEDISAGRVVLLDVDPIPMTQEYMIAYPKRLASNPALRSVIKALTK